MLKFQINDNLKAIYEYLGKTYPYYIDLRDLVQWCFEYEYYKELFENFHIIYKCLLEHNEEFPDRYQETKEEDNSIV